MSREAGGAVRGSWRRLWAVAGVALLVASGAAAGPEFADWLRELRREAASLGVSEATLEAALAGVEPIPRVLELDRSQPEFTLTLEQYLARVAPPSRVRRGRERLVEHRALLEQVSARYGVQPQYLVALWGIETDFGRITGGFPVVAALATLAHDGRRSSYFRGELLDALRILDAGHTTPERMVGSWAGAMGQPQFMPSSFQRFAVDFDGDGRSDIWETPGDVFGSAANYLAQSGWVKGQRWGRPVRLPAGLDRSLADGESRRRLSQWQSLGVRRADGQDLPKSPDLLAGLVQPDGEGGNAYLVYDNYRAILRWNRSHLFAIAAGTLAERIAETGRR